MIDTLAPPARFGALTIDRLDDGADPVEARWLSGLRIGEPDVREPHRHDYHELLWVRAGSGRHLLDGSPLPVRPGAITVIGRGQVHVFEHADEVDGALVRFRDELLLGTTPGWLLADRVGRNVPVPAREVERLESIVAALVAECGLPADVRSADLQRHLISALLLLVARWHAEARAERCGEADRADLALHHRFTRALEADFARHHGAGHYAEVLGVTAATLWRALSHATGRSTKELILERVMLEAARLLRFTDLPVQQVAQGVGFADPLYFSRAFKRQYGEAPISYRMRSDAFPRAV
jgi:AraC family transcriptional regulator, transcriptional activator of pobA